MNWHPRGFGGQRLDPENIKREGWRTTETLVLNVSDPRLTWPERQLIKQLGDRLYGQDKKKQS